MKFFDQETITVGDTHCYFAKYPILIVKWEKRQKNSSKRQVNLKKIAALGSFRIMFFKFRIIRVNTCAVKSSSGISRQSIFFDVIIKMHLQALTFNQKCLLKFLNHARI